MYFKIFKYVINKIFLQAVGIQSLSRAESLHSQKLHILLHDDNITNDSLCLFTIHTVLKHKICQKWFKVWNDPAAAV